MTSSVDPPDDRFAPDPADDPPPHEPVSSGHDAARDIVGDAAVEREFRNGLPVVRCHFATGWDSEAQWKNEVAILLEQAQQARPTPAVVDPNLGVLDDAQFAEWASAHPLGASSDSTESTDCGGSSDSSGSSGSIDASVLYDPRAVAAEKDAITEQLIDLDREEATLHARRTRLFEQYRVLSVRAVQGAQQFRAGAEKAGWNAEVIARREMITELATATHKSENGIAQLINEAEILCATLPSTMIALTEGAMSYRHASVIASQAKDVPEEMRPDFEDAVVPVAAASTVSQLKSRARIVRERLHPESIDSRKKKAVRGRYMEVDPAEDGMAMLSVKLTAVDAVGIYNRYTDTARSLQTKDEKRTLGQLRVDAFRDVAINGTIPTDSPNRTTNPETDGEADTLGEAGEGVVMAGLAATGITATVMIMVPALTALGRSDEPATLEGYGPIDLDTAMELAAGAPSWIRVLTHPETGVVMSVGNTRYKIPAAMRMWLRIRDLICRFPGCNRSAKHCDVDHIVDWQYGGHTSTDNLQHLCAGHHHVKGYTSWSVRYLENGTIEWISPAGRTHTTDPAVPIQFTINADTANGVEGDDEGEVDETAEATPAYGFLEAWNQLEADSDDDGWYNPPSDAPTPF
ncbi:uncharacterized protein DUF222 [Glaciihabitans tibetensis]|uniref:Uncharacterized protein DUF222 n=1 Tax=Glaciihabitans tibetensis TaxID=1266600 RepID=A0A2T0VG19_9MICO|nr:HNH endonuclease signature motif containing protein [Glaciihabitans tibetensis]PRY69116.1 uncharacterized protein DUF222 [Glaciihabitans tibetensis]